ncbi:MAG: glycosyltransferase, partial [bacterium]
MFDLVTVMETIQRNPLYLVGLVFFAWYPIYSSALWVFTSVVFFLRRERPGVPSASGEYTPSVTVLMAAFNEADHIKETIEGCLDIDYPDYEIVVVNDGSTDDTPAKIQPYVDTGRVRLVNKLANEGKAMALNDAVPVTNGEIILIIDADAVPDRHILRTIVPH